ncbi:DUF695 domain-containing protein [Iodobacter sp. HSC-16F04]|uniref:DUF695 domain-containing protein n=1 Tax=Iodobacter violaceini TaxID=3044271 RepID=A0ABX0KMH9_9NEIS|nr:DUF695 domain-containing protein [Iodobacter violacea]NHQ85571.1 DUF695 domain-containing protein [Iodobacter violacea]
MPDRTSIEVPEPHYTLFNATRSGQPEVIVVNDALLSFPLAEIFPWHLVVTLEVADTVENGMPSSTESAILFQIGDEIESTVLTSRTEHGSQNALFLARSTWNVQRELLFQVHDPETANQALQQLLGCRKWEREWSYRMANDASREAAANVFQLFPQANGPDA